MAKAFDCAPENEALAMEGRARVTVHVSGSRAIGPRSYRRSMEKLCEPQNNAAIRMSKTLKNWDENGKC